jgi:hypothetical protein
MSDESGGKREDVLKLNAGRGPAYPSITLSEAVQRLSKFTEANAARLALSLDTAFRVLGFKGASGASRPILASLNYYGLLDYIGRGNDRKVKLSDLAIRIVFDKMPGSPERLAALQEAALKPAIYSRLASELGLPPPSDIVMERFLVRDCEYSESTAATIIPDYLATLEYAGLNNPAKIDLEQGIEVAPAAPPSSTMLDDAIKGIGAGIGKKPVTPLTADPVTIVPPAVSSVMKVALEGDRIIVSASVDLKDAKRLVKRLQANIDLLETEVDGDDDEAAN